MKVDRIIKISGKFTIHVPHLNEMNNKKSLDKIISVSKYVKHQLCRLLNNSKSYRIDGYRHIMTKTEPHSRFFLPSAINNKNYSF